MIEADSERVLMANREAERILGCTFELGSTLGSQLHSDIKTSDGAALSQIRPILRALTEGEAIRAEEVVHRSAGGRTVPTLVSATPIYWEDGELSAAALMIQDISPLEELERLQSEFLGIVSHELRTPLTTIKGSAATVLGRPHSFDEEEILEFFHIVDEQADRMRDLLNNLSDMTRIKAGTLSVTPEIFDLEEALQAAKDTFLSNGGCQEIFINGPGASMISCFPVSADSNC